MIISLTRLALLSVQLLLSLFSMKFLVSVLTEYQTKKTVLYSLTKGFQSGLKKRNGTNNLVSADNQYVFKKLIHAPSQMI